MATAQVVEVDGRELSLTNLDKVLYPSTGFTKGEVIDYYARIALAILPHLAGRPLTLRRFPEGVGASSFFEKRCPKHRPEWVETAAIWSEREDGEIEFCVCNDKPTLVWMAQLAALELHPSLSRAGRMESPTVLAFDLDPGEPADVIDCARVALQVRSLFDGLGVECFPKTSGGKGLQVYVPLNADVTYETTKPYAHAVAQLLEKMHPDAIVSRMTKRLRKGKVFVDWSQNTESKTTVAVYSLRARERPTVSTPIEWDEVAAAAESGDPDPIRFETADVLERFEDRGDLFAPVLELEQELPGLDNLAAESE
ncbi:MAG TPA: non-homologous end-joining DNA ligase [Solirubrobacterales bacterium]|jgi:bifunctional non-homologous end joining protein LigD|nr:non-homologous end-joining DNA ligase [Solirubrobacterales bacterium]